MNSRVALLVSLAAGLVPAIAIAQAVPAAPQSAAAESSAAAAPVVPQAYPAKIALISFQQAVIATNEGQRAMLDVRKKYEPKQAQLESLNNEIESLKKGLQAAPATMSDADRAARMKTLDTKQKQLDTDTEDARNAYQADLQEAYGKIAQKVDAVLLKYVQTNGYTLLLDVGTEQSQVMWAAHNPSSDITEAVVNAYNVSSGIAAPPPDAPSAPSATHAAPSASTSHTAAKPQTK